MFINNIFQIIKEKSDIVEVAEHFGVKLNRNGFANCMFHKEKTASMSIDKNRQIFKCFGCGKGGDVIYFVQEISNCSPYEAAKQINAICNCGITFDKDNDKSDFEYSKEFAKYKYQKQIEEEEHKKRLETYNFLYDIACKINRYWHNLYIKSSFWNIDYMGDELFIIYKNKELFEYITDLFDGDIDKIYNNKSELQNLFERGIIFMDFDKISLIAYKEEEMPKTATNVEMLAYYRLKELYIKHYKKQITEEQGTKIKQKIKSQYEKDTSICEFNEKLNQKISKAIMKSEEEICEINKMIRDKKTEREILDKSISCISHLTDNPVFLENYLNNY